MVQGDSASAQGERHRIPDDLHIEREESNQQNDGKREHENPLVQTQRAGRQLHDLAEEQTAESGAQGQQPGGEEDRPVLVGWSLARPILLPSHVVAVMSNHDSRAHSNGCSDVDHDSTPTPDSPGTSQVDLIMSCSRRLLTPPPEARANISIIRLFRKILQSYSNRPNDDATDTHQMR